MDKIKGGILYEYDDPIFSVNVQLVYREWDSLHFGIPMLSLRVVAKQNMHVDDLASIIRESLSKYGGGGDSYHVCCFVDGNSVNLIDALKLNNFNLIQSRIIFLTENKVLTPGHGNLYGTRDATKQDVSQINDLVSCRRFDTRFTRDKSLDWEKSVKLYKDWFATLINNPRFQSDNRVYEKNGKVLSCIAGSWSDLPYGNYKEKNGFKIDLFLSSKDVVGSYFPMVSNLINSSIDRGARYVWGIISSDNIAAKRVLFKLGCRVIKEESILHGFFKND